MGDLKSIPLGQIRENPVALREVNRQSEAYLGLVESIKQKGFFGAISVRSRKDGDIEYFELVDGLHRFSASKDAGISHINVDVVDLNDDEVLEAQICANIHKVETRPHEYSQQLRRILMRNPLMTESELAQKLGKSGAWISQRLGLLKIDNKEIADLINEGKIPLSNAYSLAKLPADEIDQWVERAMTMAPNEFLPACTARLKEIKEERRKGKDAEPQEWQPTAHLRKASVIKTELENGDVATALIAETGTVDPIAAFNLAIKWVLHLDPTGVEEQHRAHLKRIADQEARKKEREAEKKKKEEEAAKVIKL